jgi:cyclopropane-fatty-acyl-phospholipid synthase
MSSSQYFKTANYSDAAQGTVANITDKAFHSIKELITSKAFPPIVLLARTTIIGLMEKLVRGQLRVITKEGIYTFGTPRIYGGKGSENERMDGGDPEEEVRAEIVVVNEAFWVRMLLLSDLVSDLFKTFTISHAY